jgi:hypothetical protein
LATAITIANIGSIRNDTPNVTVWYRKPGENVRICYEKETVNGSWSSNGVTIRIANQAAFKDLDREAIEGETIYSAKEYREV